MLDRGDAFVGRGRRRFDWRRLDCGTGQGARGGGAGERYVGHAAVGLLERRLEKRREVVGDALRDRLDPRFRNMLNDNRR